MKFATVWESLIHDKDHDGQRLQYEATLGIIVDLRLGKMPVSINEHHKLVSTLDAELSAQKNSTLESRLNAAADLYQKEVREVCGRESGERAPSLA